MPNGEAHEALIRQTYGAIGLDMSETAMVEAHGRTNFSWDDFALLRK